MECSFCHRHEENVEVLIAGAEDEMICDACVHEFGAVLRNDPQWVPALSTLEMCPFCGHSGYTVHRSLGSGGAVHSICSRCLYTSAEILSKFRNNNKNLELAAILRERAA